VKYGSAQEEVKNLINTSLYNEKIDGI
jgi:hypothetical protein